MRARRAIDDGSKNPMTFGVEKHDTISFAAGRLCNGVEADPGGAVRGDNVYRVALRDVRWKFDERRRDQCAGRNCFSSRAAERVAWGLQSRCEVKDVAFHLRQIGGI